MVTDVCVSFITNRLCVDKALGNFQEFDDNSQKNNVRTTQGSFLGRVMSSVLNGVTE